MFIDSSLLKVGFVSLFSMKDEELFLKLLLRAVYEDYVYMVFVFWDYRGDERVVGKEVFQNEEAAFRVI